MLTCKSGLALSDGVGLLAAEAPSLSSCPSCDLRSRIFALACARSLASFALALREETETEREEKKKKAERAGCAVGAHVCGGHGALTTAGSCDVLLNHSLELGVLGLHFELHVC